METDDGCRIVTYTVPLRQRSVYMGFIGGMEGIAIVIAPLISGAITQHVTWRWCFYLTLPIGGFTAAVVAIFFKAPHQKEASTLTLRQKVAEMDIPGMLAIMISVICLLLALQYGGISYDWSNARIIVLFIIFGISLLVFIGLQWYNGDHATLPPHVLTNRSVYLGISYSFCTASTLAVLDFYLPIWFQAVKGVDPTQSGVDVLPMIIGVIVGSISTGVVISKIGYYVPAMLLGSALLVISSTLLTTLVPSSYHGKWIGYQAMFGLGGGMAFQQYVLNLRPSPNQCEL